MLTDGPYSSYTRHAVHLQYNNNTPTNILITVHSTTSRNSPTDILNIVHDMTSRLTDVAHPTIKKFPGIVHQYNLISISHDGHVMIEIRRGMYGLHQAGILANKQLVAHLQPYG